MSRKSARRAVSLACVALTACSGDGGTNPGSRTGSITGQVHAGATPVQGAQIALSGGPTLAAGSSGQVRFDSLRPGGYTLTLEQLPAGFMLGAEPATRSVTVNAGQTASVTWNVAFRPGTISASITHGGGGVPGVQVSLAGGATQTTDMAGKVTFANVLPGDHTLNIQLPQRFALGGEPASRSVKVDAGPHATVRWEVA
ncbi:MAG: carboxypeptidase-like regulatory domain-containing protein, partial [Gemmatimonadota bacterium]|nr:carboxypeptidase-like regulatory domain-containing protein [Gemmatimonadota bacterium]